MGETVQPSLSWHPASDLAAAGDIKLWEHHGSLLVATLTLSDAFQAGRESASYADGFRPGLKWHGLPLQSAPN